MAGRSSRETAGKRLYERRRNTGASWLDVARALHWRPELPPEKRRRQAMCGARGHARTHNLPWPLPRTATDRLARVAAATRQAVETERRVRKILDGLPADRPISEDEAERVLTELYRAGLGSIEIAARMGCSSAYVLKVVRRRAPELLSRNRVRGKKARTVEQAYDLREARKTWRAEGYRRRRNQHDAGMFAAWLAGTSLRDIARRAGIGRDAVMKRISGASKGTYIPHLI